MDLSPFNRTHNPNEQKLTVTRAESMLVNPSMRKGESSEDTGTGMVQYSTGHN